LADRHGSRGVAPPHSTTADCSYIPHLAFFSGIRRAAFSAASAAQLFQRQPPRSFFSGIRRAYSNYTP
jgi:hypothetical protein